jgi:hypothetical protein
MILRALCAILLLNTVLVFGGEARIIKVLPQLLDAQGRNALSPSLFDRDAYQMVLRLNPDQVSALRFEVQYKTRGIDGPLRLRIEVRGSKTPMGKHHIFETDVKPGGWLSKWGRLQLDRATSDSIGSLVAWKASLLQNGEEIALQESFLW